MSQRNLHDGRGDDPITARERAAWIPRVLLSPLYFLTEYVLRRPLAFVVTRAEEVELPVRIVRFFHFGAADQYYLAPTFTFDLGFRPNIGLHFGADDVFTKGNALRASYSFGGLSWHATSLTERYEWKSSERFTWEVGIRTRFVDRNDGRFFGLGREARRAADSRYDYLQSDTELYVSRARTTWTTVRLGTSLRYRRFGDDVDHDDEDDRTVADALAAGLIDELPPGFEDGYLVHHTELSFSVDSRPARPEPQSGVRLSGSGAVAYSVRDRSESLYVRWDAALAAFVDLSGSAHVVSLSVSASEVEDVRGRAPFTELPMLSGTGPMPGFRGGFLQGPSAASIALRYRWPIWVYLDGTISAAVGNVFDAHFAGFAPDNLRMSFDLGIAAVTQRDHFFEFVIGFGTKTFAQGTKPETLRLMVGGRREF